MKVKLTQYSHGAGCGCKISPAVLDEILKNSGSKNKYPNLLVGNDSRDDAAAVDIGNGTCILSTTDFFMPIVDDPFTFGKIAATNALSDIYAMGGKPLMAISIFGWPVDKLSAEIGKMVIDGGRSVCDEANIPLAGGHSIDSPEPIFGLAVTGIAEKHLLKRNDTATEDCSIFLTKPLGIGILSTARKMGEASEEEIQPAIRAMCKLNSIGSVFARQSGVVALTDVTGFGLLGHLSEICEGSNISARVFFDKVPLLTGAKEYAAKGCIPGGTVRNFQSYGSKIGKMTDEQTNILCDAQTSGGLIVVVKKAYTSSFLQLAVDNGFKLEAIGETCARAEKLIEVV